MGESLEVPTKFRDLLKIQSTPISMVKYGVK